MTLSAPPPIQRGRIRLDGILLVLLIACHIASVLAFKYFAAQDGPMHTSNGWVLSHYFDPGYEWLRDAYVINPPIGPYWVIQLFFALLDRFMSPLASEKVFLVLYFIAFPLAARYAVMAVNPKASFFVFLLFPFMGNWFFHSGFYNFSISFTLYLFFIGYWLRNRLSLNIRKGLFLAGFFALSYYSHLVSTAEVFLFVAVVEIAYAARERSWPWKRFLIFCLAAIPVVFLTAQFLLGHQSVNAEMWMRDDTKERIRYLFRMNMLVSYFPVESVWGKCLLVIMCALGCLHFFRFKLFTGKDPFIRLVLTALGVATLAAYFVAPFEGVDATYVSTRMSLYPLVALVLWLATFDYGPLSRLAIRAAGVTVTLGLLVLHIQGYQKAQPYLEEYISAAPHIQPGKTLLDLTWCESYEMPPEERYSLKVDALRHAWGYLMFMSRTVGLSNYQSEDFWPVAVRKNISFDRGGSCVDCIPPKIDLEAYEAETGRPIDYVLLWDYPQTPKEKALYETFITQLEFRYNLIYTSKPHKLARLYERNANPS